MALELTSTDDIQTYLNDTSISTTTLTFFANAAEARIANYCGRRDESGANWLSASRTEYIDGELSQSILLRFTPISAVATVSLVESDTATQSIATTLLELDGKAISDLSTSNLGTTGRLGFRATCGLGSLAFDFGYPDPAWAAWWASNYPNFGAGRQRVKVTYTGGYAAAPDDLAMAATMLAASMYRESARDPALTSQTLGKFSQTWKSGANDESTALGSIADMLLPYRRMLA